MAQGMFESGAVRRGGTAVLVMAGGGIVNTLYWNRMLVMAGIVRGGTTQIYF